jgi:hypothetical protein
MSNIDLINTLSEDLKPTKRLSSPFVRFLYWFIPTLICIGLGIYFLGIREDLQFIRKQSFFQLETLSLFVIGVISALGAFLFSVPGEEKTKAQKWFILLPSLIWPLILSERLLALVFTTGEVPFHVPHGLSCIRDIFILGLLPGILLFYLVNKAAPLKFELAGWLTALSAASLGAFGLQFTCVQDHPFHVFLWHILPVFALAGVGICLGKKFLKW